MKDQKGKGVKAKENMELTFPSQGSKYLKLEEESNAGGGQDMISKLPDCILSYILSFLPTKHIIQTALLSRRWQYLWTSISNIDLYDESSIQSKSAFLDFVERVLLLHDASDIKTFRLNICVPINPSRINSWVSRVVMHKVQELHLSLPVRISFLLPCCLFTCASLAFLKLEMGLLVVPTSVELPRLKRLDLLGVMFPDDNSIERFLSKCPVLEELNFQNCGWVNTKRITISIPSLREFTFFNDFYPLGLLDCTIEIYASNLVSLSYESDLRVNCLLQDLPSSVDASIDLFCAREEHTSSARRLFDCFLNVKSLTVTGGTLQYLPLVDYLATQHLVARLPTFNNMTTFEVNLAVSTSTTKLVMGFLQNTPNLQLLVVNFTEIEIDHEFTEDWDHEVVPSCFGSCLKTINIYCFDGYEEDVHLLKFLLKKTTVLERMSICCTEIFWSNSEKQEQEMKRGNNMDPTFQLHCSKHQKLEKESNDSEDRISNLPDCLLCSILSLLPTKDTIQTSILSKRWRHLWVSMDDKFMSKLSFADIVERVLLLHDPSDIKSFRLSFTVPFIRFRFYSWVFAALKHRVQELDLSLPIRTNYLLPSCLFTSKSLTVLKIAMDLDLDVPTSMGLPSLKRLDLKMVTFSDEESFEQLISSCPMLQDLTFRDCNWVNIRKATIYVPSLKRFTLTYDDLRSQLIAL